MKSVANPNPIYSHIVSRDTTILSNEIINHILGLRISPSREAGPLTHVMTFHENLFLLQIHKNNLFKFVIFGGADFFFTLSQFK
jgi:hypothetical protein